MMLQFLADSLLVIHALFIAFVILGLVLIVTGMLRQWRWIKNLWFRVIHLLAIGFVVAESWFGRICPLTEWENRLREAAGGVGYSDSFIEYWLHEIVFYDLPPWLFTMAYTIFGILVLLAWILVPPRFSRR
ncbi:MAG: DUF2784 domain-containing protein [Gammaproteobacteria bacterium]|nr:DUF2784 domain-containing protein [Gammaproteobacteria bacterium]